jgi:hypothetical protein
LTIRLWAFLTLVSVQAIVRGAGRGSVHWSDRGVASGPVSGPRLAGEHAGNRRCHRRRGGPD